MAVLSARAERAIWNSFDPSVEQIRDLTQARRDANQLYRRELKRPDLYGREITRISCLERFCITAQGLSRYEAASLASRASDVLQMLSTATDHLLYIEANYEGARTQSLRGRLDVLESLHDYLAIANKCETEDFYPRMLDDLMAAHSTLQGLKIGSPVLQTALRIDLEAHVATRRAGVIQQMTDIIEAQAGIIADIEYGDDVADAYAHLDSLVGAYPEYGSEEGDLLGQIMDQHNLPTFYTQEGGWKTIPPQPPADMEHEEHDPTNLQELGDVEFEECSDTDMLPPPHAHTPFVGPVVDFFTHG